MSGLDFTLPIVLLGTLTGLGYALLGVGLVLTYRSSRFINFSHAAIGLFAAALFAFGTRYGVPYVVGFPAALGVGALLGIAIEALIVRRLARAPRVLAMIVTLGIAEALILFSLSLNSGGLGGRTFPLPPVFPAFEVGPLYVNEALSALLILSPVVLALLVSFLQKSRYGIAIRGAASNPDAATLAGADPGNMAMLSWGLAGCVSAFAALLILPTKGGVTPDSLGPDFLLRGLAAAALARFSSLSLALVAGVGLGILEAVLATDVSAAGYFEVAVLLLVLAGVALQSRSPKGGETERWAELTQAKRLPASYRKLGRIRWTAAASAVFVLAMAAAVPAWASNQNAFILTTVFGFAIVGISVSFLTGVGGQLSLGQLAYGAIGAVTAVAVLEQTGSLLLALLAAAALGGVIAAVVGVPALRVRGQLLGVATLAFALMTSGWLLRQDWAFGRTGRSAPDRVIAGVELSTSRSYYYVGLVSLLVALGAAVWLRRSKFGQQLRAVRDNEEAARVLRAPAPKIKLASYAFAGTLAGLGGAVMAFAGSHISTAQFGPRGSIEVVAVSVIGGLGSFVGPLLGALYLVGIPRLFEMNLTALAALNAAWLILILEQPRGLAGLGSRLRDGFCDAAARISGLDPARERSAVALPPRPQSAALPPPEAPAEPPISPTSATSATFPNASPAASPTSPTSPVSPTSPAGGELLVVDGLSKRFGGVTALEDVSFSVSTGERLGIIGPNGAGKTTLFDLIGGSTRPDSGAVSFDGADISSYPPEKRSRLGLVRSFQNSRMFPSMTVLETVSLAASSNPENPDPEELLYSFSLESLALMPLSAVPTGTRRIVQLAACAALSPRLLLLDEPSAGVAGAETEHLTKALDWIGRTHGTTFVIIEHDIGLLSRICDRMIALEVGRLIAEGTPSEVQSHPEVIRSYIGGQLEAG